MPAVPPALDVLCRTDVSFVEAVGREPEAGPLRRESCDLVLVRRSLLGDLPLNGVPE